jgi:iron complex outermembrane recepter protein
MRSPRTGKVAVAAAVLALGALPLGSVLSADATTPLAVDLDPQPLEAALVEFSKQGHLQLIISTGTLPVKVSVPLHGSMSIGTALDLLLKDTGLSYKFVGEHTIAIVKPAGQTGQISHPAAALGADPDGTPMDPSVVDTGVSINQTSTGSDLMKHGGLMLRLAALLGLCASVSVPDTGCAQDAGSGSVQLQEVVVTAEHSKATAQNTPIAMSVYSGDVVKLNAITDMESLSAVAPDINYADVQGTPIVTIRGISSRDVTEKGDPAIAVSTDGFYLNRPYSLDATMYDLDRVEVLRGPQGTLSGRNSVGGAINIVTAQPTSTYDTYGSVEYGDYNELKLEGMVNLPLSDAVQVRTAFFSLSHDGYRDNAPQIDGDDADEKSARIEVAFEPFENFRGVVTGQYTTERGAGDVGDNVPFVYSSTGALDHALPAGINSETFPLGTEPLLNLNEGQVRFNLQYDIGSIEVTALGGFDRTDWHHEVDDTSLYADPIVSGFLQNEYPDTLNGELRVASRDSQPLQWQVGTYFFRESSNLVSSDVSPQTDGTYDEFFGFVYVTKDLSRAGYAQASYQFTDALKLTAGVRYTSDYKSESGYYGDLTGNIVYANQAGSESSSKTTYHLALDYKATTQNLLYAKVDTGYKAGGFNFGGPDYQPETDTSYEIGSKNRFFDNMWQFNTALFYDSYKDLQESVGSYLAGTGGQAIEFTENAGAARIHGFENELIGTIPWLGTLNLTADYLHARYTDFISVADQADPSLSGNVQLAGNTLPQAPTWSFALGLEHSWNVPGGSLTGTIQTKAQTSSNFSFYNYADTRQGAYTMSDAFLSYQPGNANWKVTAFVRNFENSAVFVNAQENVFSYSYTYQFYPPRTYGLRLEYSLSGWK